MPSSPIDQGLVRNLSTRSQHAIDIPSNDDEEEENEEQQLQNTVVRIVQERNLNSLKNFGSVEKVTSIFGSHLEREIECIQDPQGDIVCLEKGDRVPSNGLVVVQKKDSMLVILVVANISLGKLLSLVIQDPNKSTLLEAHIKKPNAYVENLSLFVSVLIVLVVFIRLLCGKHNADDNEFPELKGNILVNMLMKIFEGILFKPQGRISILESAFTVVVIAIQHAMPFVITITLYCWNYEVVKNQAEPQNLSACAIMGIVTVMCTDATRGLVCQNLEVNKFSIDEKDLNNDVDSGIDQVVIKALW
ncbi:hypothetical protein ACOSP7_002880 [Xanthoceras sorbifolium]